MWPASFAHVGLTLAPTFIPFTPWTTREQYREMLALLMELDLIEHVAPIQLALRLLIPSGSRLLELADVQAVIGEFDERALLYRWRHPDPPWTRWPSRRCASRRRVGPGAKSSATCGTW